MNKLLLVIIGVLTLSCTTQKGLVVDSDYAEGFPYIFPTKVQELLFKKLENVEEPVYLLLDKRDFRKYIVSVNSYDPSTFKGINWIKNTNRYAYIKGEFYPLIFESDQLFSTPQTVREFSQSIDAEGNYTITTMYRINEYAYYIEFTIKGEILYEGFDPSILQKQND